jgi:periplasmic protein TonB
MKKSIQLFALFVLSVCLSCGSKAKDETATDATSVVKVAEISPEAKKAEERAAKRAKIEKAKTEKEAERRATDEEKAKTSPSYKDASGKTVYYKVESEPTYPGGNEAMRKYLSDNLVYPKEALDNQTEGTVFVDFIVSHNGKVRDVNASDVAGDNIDQSLKEEAGRIVASMPAWVPGRLHGKSVDTKFSIPITFEIN